MRRMRSIYNEMVLERSLKYINILVLVLLLVGLAATWWFGWRTLPDLTSDVQAPISEEAQIHRDMWGIPHIEAKSLEDAMFLQGYATAQDRLWQLDALRRSTAGELAEVAGRAVLPMDQNARRVGYRRTADLQAAHMEPQDRALFAAYARGVNHFMDSQRDRLPPEFVLLGYQPRPWTISDSLLVALRMATDLSTSWKSDLDGERMRKELAGTFPNLNENAREELLQKLFPMRSGEEVLAGSNAWAISGKLTASGKPLLANDTHLGVTFPSTWTMVSLHAPGLHVKGFALPGLPGVIIGHNDRIAWGTTNLAVDVQDLYEERMDLASARYQVGNEIRAANQIVEVIRVKGEADIALTVLETHHGPLIHTEADKNVGRNLALQWTALSPDFLRYPFLDLNRASNWEEFRAALSRFVGPPQNFFYADVDGNIGYQATGRIPIRATGTGKFPYAGADPTQGWVGFIPYDELPRVYNPPSGWVVSGNQNPFPADYPRQVNGRFVPPDRANQIIHRLQTRKDWDAAGMMDVQKDVYSAHHVFVAKHMVAAADRVGVQDAFVKEAVEQLRSWNGQSELDQVGATIARGSAETLRVAILKKLAPDWPEADFIMDDSVVQWVLRTKDSMWAPNFDEWLLTVLSESLANGRKTLGGDLSKWKYQEISKWDLSHPIFGRLPLVGRWLGNGKVSMSGSTSSPKQISATLGPSQRFVADLGDWEKSFANMTLGISGHPLSSHYKDQWEDYYYGRPIRMPFQKPQIDTEQRFVPVKP